MLMGIADLIIDARSDYKANYLTAPPSLSMYLKLCGILVRQGLGLFWSFPSKRKFVVYSFKMLGALAFAKD